MLPVNNHYFLKLHCPVVLCNDDVRWSWISCFKKSTEHLHSPMICCHTAKKPVTCIDITPMTCSVKTPKHNLAALEDWLGYALDDTRFYGRQGLWVSPQRPAHSVFYPLDTGGRLSHGRAVRDWPLTSILRCNPSVRLHGVYKDNFFRHQLNVNFHYIGRCPNDPAYITPHDPSRSH
jgi:hypothetical protein